ncbi:PH domain-containing protein [Buchananella hordeovulneris]|uniref:PH domain-containing protein n=1 Tax=Buchananella hordeovulneris TaxID=52770 RepID=UPI000A0111E5|nr:PH domain-containing protein [Buchananella hordeovulneris]MDO5080474.1 PH domain-containing protein [Buchananella hordeovulneris]RRD44299.1 hypothetical protein EII13_04160 [Buchananella hordeovulneris]
MTAPLSPGSLPGLPPQAAGQVGQVTIDGRTETVVWRRVSPITPLANTWQALTVLLFVVTINVVQAIGEARQELDEDFVGQASSTVGRLWQDFGPLVLVVPLVILLLLVGYFVLAWRRITYTVTSDSVVFRQGVLQRKERVLRVTRLQTIDVVRPLLGRIFGLGNLKVEAAGGTGSNIEIGLLKEAELRALRAEILARAAGVTAAARPAPSAPHPQVPAVAIPSGFEGGLPMEAELRAPEAPEREIYAVPTGMFLLSLLRSGSVLTGILVVLAALGGGIWMLSEGVAIGTILFSSLAPTVVVFASLVWYRFAGEFGFRAALSPDGIRIQRGLTQSVALTVPPRRIQMVVFRQPLLWRGKDWWRVVVRVPGHERAESNSKGDPSGEVTLLPVGSRTLAEYALWLAVPDLGVEPARIPSLLGAGLLGKHTDGGFVPSPPSARFFDPLVRARRGLVLTPTVALVRYGWFVRKLAVVPLNRVQSLALRSGPLERAAGLATLQFHSAGALQIGGTAKHLDVRAAEQALQTAAHFARQARHSEPPEQWMQRVASVASPPVA